MEEQYGTCDLCGKEANAAFEDCHSLECTANCNRGQGDIYHCDCLKKYIAQGTKGTAKHLPNIPYSNFHCPKGKGKGTRADTPCKGLAHHCRRIIIRAEPKAAPPPVVLQRQPKPKPAPKPAAPPKPPKPKAPQANDFNPRVRLPPMPVLPKADPLGRNLNGKAEQELPPGWVDESEEAADKAKAGKAAKKNQRRAARRKDEAGSSGLGDASSANGSLPDSSAGMPPTEDVLGGSGWEGAAAGGGAGSGAEERSVAGGTRFITDYNAYVSLLAKHMDLSDSDYEQDEPGDQLHTARHSTAHHGGAPLPQWSHQQQGEEADGGDPGIGWQAVGARGRAAAPAAAPPAAAEAAAVNRAQQGGEGPAIEWQQREEELLRAALEASLADQAPAAAAAGEDDAFEAALAQAVQESLAAEAARQQWELEATGALQEEASLTAQMPLPPQQQQQVTASCWDAIPYQQQQQQADVGRGNGDGWGAAAAAATTGDAWGAAAAAATTGFAWGSAGSADSAATAWDMAPHSTPQHSTPYHQQQQQGSFGTYPSSYTAVPPAATPAAAAPAAAAAAAASPQYITYTLPQPAAVTPAPAPLTPAGLLPTTSTPVAAYQQQQGAVSLQQQQQRQVPLPWLQPAAGSSSQGAAGYAASPAAAAAGGGYVPTAVAVGNYNAPVAAAGPTAASYGFTPVSPAAAAADDDDDEDLDTLMAILGV